jgi:translation initiation factor 2 gamma subunit (eIF-2gamma)
VSRLTVTESVAQNQFESIQKFIQGTIAGEGVCIYLLIVWFFCLIFLLLLVLFVFIYYYIVGYYYIVVYVSRSTVTESVAQNQFESIQKFIQGTIAGEFITLQIGGGDDWTIHENLVCEVSLSLLQKLQY